MNGAFYSWSKNSNELGRAYQYYILNNFSIKGSISYENLFLKFSDYHSLKIKPEIVYTILGNRKSIFLNLKGGFLSGVAFNDRNVINQNYSNFIYGPLIGATTEIFISAHIKLEFEFEQRLLLNSSGASYKPYFTIGTYVKF